MFTRSRQSQNFNSGTPQRAQAGNQQFQGQNQANNTPYKQQPQQTAQQPQTPQQQQMRAQATKQPAPANQGQQQQGGAPQQRLKPILKSAGPTMTNNQNQAQGQNQKPQQVSQQMNQQQQQQQQPQQQANNGVEIPELQEKMEVNEGQDVPRWKRKIPGLKVNRKLKRLRLNQRLRKTLQPKNAIMVLNEMKSGVQFTFPETTSNLPNNSLFLVHVEVDGKTYVGQGLSKLLARQNAAENALKSLLLEKMTAAAMKARLDSENDGNTASESGETKESGEAMETSNDDSDEIPWSSLASFALYKLFLEWQNQGTVVPVPRPGLSPGKPKKEQPKSTGPKELPPNALTIHPVMLLNQMRPGVTYNEVSRVGNPPNTMFTLATEIDGQEFVGTAKNKKDAKKIAAKAALQTLFNLVYPEEKEEDAVMA